MQRQINFLRSIAPRRENVRTYDAPPLMNTEPLPSYESQFGNLPSYGSSQVARLEQLEKEEFSRRKKSNEPINRREIEQIALSQFRNQMSIIEQQMQSQPPSLNPIFEFAN